MTQATTSIGAGMFIAGPQAHFMPDSALHVDAYIPDGQNKVWPTPHDAKIDIATMIEVGLEGLGISDVPVLKDGSFHSSQLMRTDARGDSVAVPVITISRVSDIEHRIALGKLIGAYPTGDPRVIDPTGLTAGANTVTFSGNLSDVTIDVTISDLNGFRADQMYLLCKYIMECALPEFNRIGYQDVKRVNGQDLAKIEINDPAPGIVYSRTLTYACIHPSFVASIDTLVHLVKQTLTVNPGPSDSTISTDL